MGLGILLGAVSLWFLNKTMKGVKRSNKRLVIGVTYTI
jgi:hypothetical protein